MKNFSNLVWYWWNRWRMFQHQHSRSILFQSLREIRGRYLLWRMRSRILKQPRSLMVAGKQVYRYVGGTYGEVKMIPIDPA